MGNCVFRAALLCASILFLAPVVDAQDLSLSADDLRIELRAEGGYHLFIRYKPDISSVLLTETTRDPRFRAENYAYRSLERNSINGDEIRLINGYPIPRESRIYSLISSNPVWHNTLGWAYHIYIPHILYYGYEGGRHGEVQVGDGTYLNIRAFYYAYADYRGPFKDNPFVLRVTQEAAASANAGTYRTETVSAFTEIARENTTYSHNPANLVERIGNILRNEAGKNVDIVICMDATGSMRPYMDMIRAQLISTLQDIVPGFDSFRIGMVLYKDYYDDYLNKVIPFTDDFSTFQKSLDAVKTGGGGDIPEAVHEALYAGATQLPWAAESRLMILIGDAPPHPRPRGRITKQSVDREIAQRGISVHAIILSQ